MLDENTYMSISLIIALCIAIMKLIGLVITIKKYLKEKKK